MRPQSKWSSELRCCKKSTENDTVKPTRMKTARKKKMKENQPNQQYDGGLPIYDVVEDVLKYMKKKEKTVTKINEKKVSQQNEKNELNEIRMRIDHVEESLTFKISQLEGSVSSLKALFDDMKRSNEESNAKWEADLNSFIGKCQTKSEKDKLKIVASVQKLQKEHDEFQKSTTENFKKLEHHNKKVSQGFHGSMDKIADDLTKTKDDVDMLMKKRFGIVIGSTGDHKANQLDTSFSGFCSVDEGVDFLSHRMNKLDNRIAEIEQQDISQRTSKTKRPSRTKSVASSRHRKPGQGLTNDVEDDSPDSLEALEGYDELTKRISKNEANIAKLFKRNRHHSSETGDEGLENMHGQIKTLQKKIKSLGESTSRACRSLSVGVTDSQNAALQLFIWADKVHTAFDVVSKKALQLDKNLCPRAKLVELAKPSANNKESGDREIKRGMAAPDDIEIYF